MARKTKYWALLKPAGIGGVVTTKPRRRKQDKRATAEEMYAVIFFPKISSIGRAHVNFFGLRDTLSATPQAARVRFMDRIAKDQSWATYAKAGHKIRRVRVIDLGDAPREGSKPGGARRGSGSTRKRESLTRRGAP